MEASSPTGPYIEPEPREWQPRAMWVGSRLLCGAAAFFFMAFVFAYFYLRSLNVHGSWKIGAVNPSIGLGVAIAVVLVASAALLRAAVAQSAAAIRLGTASLLLALLAVVLQVVEWTTLGFGGASGAYASVFIGWTATYVVFAVCCIYWIQTQIATIRRERREGPGLSGPELTAAGLEACSFFWTFYVAIGVLAFVILYLV
jgi:heme/copper-type cytochrome/quinol oxidase subunit 3